MVPGGRNLSRLSSATLEPFAKCQGFRHAINCRQNARCRGHKRILTDVLARTSAINLARLATLGVHHGATGWAIA